MNELLVESFDITRRQTKMEKPQSSVIVAGKGKAFSPSYRTERSDGTEISIYKPISVQNGKAVFSRFPFIFIFAQKRLNYGPFFLFIILLSLSLIHNTYPHSSGLTEQRHRSMFIQPTRLKPAMQQLHFLRIIIDKSFLLCYYRGGH